MCIAHFVPEFHAKFVFAFRRIVQASHLLAAWRSSWSAYGVAKRARQMGSLLDDSSLEGPLRPIRRDSGHSYTGPDLHRNGEDCDLETTTGLALSVNVGLIDRVPSIVYTSCSIYMSEQLFFRLPCSRPNTSFA